ncbi:hypothetical protein ACQ4PT_025795 [Festuca glaucescens]
MPWQQQKRSRGRQRSPSSVTSFFSEQRRQSPPSSDGGSLVDWRAPVVRGTRVFAHCARQEEHRARVADLLEIPLAAALLRHFRWCVTAVKDRWFADEQRICDAAGLPQYSCSQRWHPRCSSSLAEAIGTNKDHRPKTARSEWPGSAGHLIQQRMACFVLSLCTYAIQDSRAVNLCTPGSSH